MKRYYIFLATVAVISVIAVMVSNFQRRDPVHDRTAVSDLNTLSNEIDTYYLREKELPTSLSDITVQDRNVLSRASRYDYRKVSQTSYELCAIFKTKNRENYMSSRPEPVPDDGTQKPDPSNHDKGHECFLYPVIPVGHVVPPTK
jgi:hypothetical protein